MRVRSLDPGGRKGLAWADFGNGDLVRCGVARTKEREMGKIALDFAKGVPSLTPDVVIVEEMCIYPGQTASLGAENDLLKIQALASYVAGRSGASQVIWVKAREWKGNVPKNVTRSRVHDQLNVVEALVFQQGIEKLPAALHEDVYDAVALGLYYLKRYR